VYGIADRRLGDGWAFGDYSIADIHLFRLYWRLFNSPKQAPGEFPNLDAHYARMMARPAVQKTIEIEAARWDTNCPHDTLLRRLRSSQ
jgi:glutathione S-transferase